MSILGVDISTHNGEINFAELKKSASFVICRGGYGKESNQIDAAFYRNIQGCQANNMPIAVYWYSYSDSIEHSLQEANVCYNTVKNIKNVKFIAYDVEDKTQVNLHNPTLVTNMSNTFLDFFKSKGYTTMFYSYQNFINNSVNWSEVKSHGHKLWLAYYNGNPNIANHSNVADIWQYSSTGHVNGINGNVDMNICYNTSLFNTLATQWKSDTTHDFVLAAGTDYTFKITANGYPDFKTMNGKALSTSLEKQVGNDYYMRIHSTGVQGTYGVNIGSLRVCNVTIVPFKSDTTTIVKIKKGNSYIAKITCNKQPNIICGTGGVCQVSLVNHNGYNYFYKFTAIGQVGSGTGVYINGNQTSTFGCSVI